MAPMFLFIKTNKPDLNNYNNENFMIFKQYYIYNYTPLYLNVVHNWLVCYQNLKLAN